MFERTNKKKKIDKNAKTKFERDKADQAFLLCTRLLLKDQSETLGFILLRESSSSSNVLGFLHPHLLQAKITNV
ncbi:CLUMA_CG017438, isoform A [Clunio marinus]|uniref:CLUMA_CG017438, isoform A n=1 Tax=Clunio marinus TaxID=568069 RepID=A0A1J1J0H8_9DIPT|nr:CLUMA_CG017438, isoform A [Clunio marinus]